MNSSISWLDFSNTDRQKVLEILNLFRLQDTRDELGLAPVRDTFADLLFPGTSTLQTRARYFIIIPWLLQCYIEDKNVPSVKANAELRKIEIWVIDALKKQGINDGVIGQRSGSSLQRFPSNIYWVGLQRWGILKYQGTQGHYTHWLDSFYARRDGLRSMEASPEYTQSLHNWDPSLFSMLPNVREFWNAPAFDLSLAEAEYLRERLQLTCQQSALAFLSENARGTSAVNFIWQHPQRGEFPPQLACWVDHAQNFSECMVGAALLYNYLLARLRGVDDWIQNYELKLNDWRENLCQRQGSLLAWDRQDFWHVVKGSNRKIHPATERFLTAWLDRLLEPGGIANPLQDLALHQLIEQRELQLKRSRSRFVSARHRELWGGASGTGQLNYRWNIAQRMLNDILEGLDQQEQNLANHR